MFLQLGSRPFDVSERPVVVGVLNRTRDSFSDHGAFYELDALLGRAVVADGTDVLEVGARPGGVGVADVPPDRERDLAAETSADQHRQSRSVPPSKLAMPVRSRSPAPRVLVGQTAC
jgi:dihydropteroate synthase